ncbi:hypothetical protein HanXRQr2_Chr09g0390841 [Helianthus annuus]|uniref:Uncharacterized protein n=1 Tax=Helianthus annuus TaxID=4232 RepID=A0A251TWK3_HELAN|nr:hypothetical protein HanXRQr2_Chr09g0390841 [Helianthus annuus]
MNSQRDLGSHILFLHKKIRLLKSTLILSDLICRRCKSKMMVFIFICFFRVFVEGCVFISQN